MNTTISRMARWAGRFASLGWTLTAGLLNAAADPFGDVLGQPGLSWSECASVAPWVIQDAVTHNGAAALASGTITDNQASTLCTTISGPTMVRFWWKVSSERSDRLTFVVADAQSLRPEFNASISGDVDWQQVSFPVNPGPHRISWSYEKDRSQRQGQDKAWVSQVAFVAGTPVAPKFTVHPFPVTLLEGGAFNVNGSATGYPIYYQWVRDGIPIPGATNSVFSASNAAPALTGTYQLTASNELAVATSDPAYIYVARKLAARPVARATVTTGPITHVGIVHLPGGGASPTGRSLANSGPNAAPTSSGALVWASGQDSVTLLAMPACGDLRQLGSIPTVSGVAPAFLGNVAFTPAPSGIRASVLSTVSPGVIAQQVFPVAGGVSRITLAGPQENPVLIAQTLFPASLVSFPLRTGVSPFLVDVPGAKKYAGSPLDKATVTSFAAAGSLCAAGTRLGTQMLNVGPDGAFSPGPNVFFDSSAGASPDFLAMTSDFLLVAARGGRINGVPLNDNATLRPRDLTLTGLVVTDAQLSSDRHRAALAYAGGGVRIQDVISVGLANAGIGSVAVLDVRPTGGAAETKAGFDPMDNNRLVEGHGFDVQTFDLVGAGESPGGPEITEQPADAEVPDLRPDTLGALRFRVKARGTPVLHFEWYKVEEGPGGLVRSVALDGEFQDTLDASRVLLDWTSPYSGVFVRVTDGCGKSVDSRVARLNVMVPPCVEFVRPLLTVCQSEEVLEARLIRYPGPGSEPFPAQTVKVSTRGNFISIVNYDVTIPVQFAAGAAETRVTYPVPKDVRGHPLSGEVVFFIAGTGFLGTTGPKPRCPADLVRELRDSVRFDRIDCDPARLIEMPFPVVDVYESDKAVNIPVKRSGDTGAPASASYRIISPGNGPNDAVTGLHFLGTGGIIEFPAGSVTASIKIPILDDGVPGDFKIFDVDVLEGQGLSLSKRTRTRVVIHDNDPAPGQPAPTPLPSKDCVRVPGPLTVSGDAFLAYVPFARTVFPVGSVALATVRARSEVPTASELPPGTAAAIPGVDFAPVDEVMTFPEGHGPGARWDLLVILDGNTPQTQAVRRIKLRLAQPTGTSLCDSDTVFVDLVPVTNAAPGLTLSRTNAGAGEKILIGWTGPGYSGQKRDVAGGADPIPNPAGPMVVDVGGLQQKGAYEGFLVRYPLPLSPNRRGGGIPPTQPPTDEASVDFGDAPASYEELPVFGPPGKAANPSWPAGHVVDPVVKLGRFVDTELFNQPTLLADGDDRAGLPDDDGVVFRRPLVAGGVAEIEVTASQPGFLDAWIDYDQDGTFLTAFPAGVTGPDNDLRRALVTPAPLAGAPGGSIPLVAGPNTLRFLVPTNAVPGRTYARFRFSRGGGQGPLFMAPDGEVEDYVVQVWGLISDFGDAPDDGFEFRYPTLINRGGAYHLATLPDFCLGKGVDFEPDGRPDPNALGDDEHAGANAAMAANGHDEDGLVSIPKLTPGGAATIAVFATVRSVQEGKLDAWIDWNRDGDWDDPGEHFVVAAKVLDGTNAYSFQVPAAAIPGRTFLRLRLTRDGIERPGGPALTGEVEDYSVTIAPR